MISVVHVIVVVLGMMKTDLSIRSEIRAILPRWALLRRNGERLYLEKLR
jgi:hypothetical protein